MQMKKSLIALTVAASLTALTGCGSSDSGDNDDGVSTASYSGTVNKGIVSNGKVEVCDVFDALGCIEDESSFYQTTTTSEDGSYDVTGAPIDTPLLVLISEAGEGDTTMKCDLETCNAGADGFGDTFTVASGWTLQAIIPAATSATTTVNVTSLTDLAADKAIETAGGSGVTEAIAENANQAVQEAFGLTSDITEIGALDLTDADAVDAETSTEEVKAALYSAVLMDVSDSDKEAILDLNDDGSYTVKTSTNSTVVTAYAAAQSLADIENLKLVNVASEISSEATKIQESDTLTTTVVDINSDEIEQAEDFIQDVRTAYNAVQEEGDLTTNLEDFSDQFDGIDDLVSDDFNDISEKLNLAVTAIASVLDTEDEYIPETGTYTASNGYIVTIAYNAATASETAITAKDAIITVTDASEDATVLITATANSVAIKNIETENSTYPDNEEEWWVDDYDYSETETYSSSADIQLTLDTVKISQGDTTLTANGSVTVKGFVVDGSWSRSDTGTATETETSFSDTYVWTNAENETQTLASASIELEATLAYSTEESNASFDGSITLELEGVEYSSIDAENGSGAYTNTWSETDNTYSNENDGKRTQEEKFTAKKASIVFHGDLTNPAAETLGVYVSLNMDNSLGYTQENTWSNAWSSTWNNEEGESSTYDDTSSEETKSSFVKASAIARVETELTDADGEAMSASIELNANRTAYDLIDTSISIDYNDVEIILEADVYPYSETASELTIRNTTGVVATVNAFADDADIEGTITVDNVKAAAIEDGDSGLVLIRYTDGTFESLF